MTKAGPSVKQEYAAIDKSLLQGPLETNAGHLKCRKILFQPWLINRETNEAFYQSIRDFVAQAVEHAIKHQHTSIAVPAIGCGKINADKNAVAREMLYEVQRQLLAANVLPQIIFVILPYEKELFQVFRTQLAHLQNGQLESNESQLCYTLKSE
jgi:O-acetyl-ADP-ribose deacetylase (regulator of RNase III)